MLLASSVLAIPVDNCSESINKITAVNPLNEDGSFRSNDNIIDTFKDINCFANKTFENHKSFLGIAQYEMDSTRVSFFFQIITFIEYLAIVSCFSIPFQSYHLR